MHVQVLQPAIELAENGFPVSPVTAYGRHPANPFPCQTPLSFCHEGHMFLLKTISSEPNDMHDALASTMYLCLPTGSQELRVRNQRTARHQH